jgi:glutamate formiminotransferase
MRLLTVPNWSFGRDRALLQRCREVLGDASVEVHYCASDVDHNRTVTAFSGDAEAVMAGLRDLADLVLPSIDLNRHMGVHPRIGGMDVCPFVILDDSTLAHVNQVVQAFGEGLAERWEIPIYLYEKSEMGRHEADLPSLRRGGFGALAGKELRPDYGPTQAHPRLGVTVMGVRDFLIAINVNLRTEELSHAKEIAKIVRGLRSEGDERFLGVRALAFPLNSRSLTQVSLNLTLPDLTPVDAIVEWVAYQATKRNIALMGTELIGVIREKDLGGASRLSVDRDQIV